LAALAAAVSAVASAEAAVALAAAAGTEVAGTGDVDGPANGGVMSTCEGSAGGLRPSAPGQNFI
jgi:hypothetical protein